MYDFIAAKFENSKTNQKRNKSTKHYDFVTVKNLFKNLQIHFFKLKLLYL